MRSLVLHSVEFANMSAVRPCRKDECSTISEIINAAAEAYRGVIPADRWHDPYMSLRELDSEISAGVVFWACESEGEVIGVMGIQAVRDVDLVRHAYVSPGSQHRGIGAALMSHIRSLSSRQLLVGTWAAATWAIAFYQRHGFVLVSPEQKTALLKTYWTIPERQIETSVVMANPPLSSSS
jgi:N-acetylglutamate synthase-like GNAT family acetyltransferase